MKLLTHNMLTSSIIKGVKKGYPLNITAKNIKVTDMDFNPDFVIRMIPKIDWNALVGAANTLGHGDGLPQELEAEYEQKPDFLKKVHHVLLEIDVDEGSLICPETGRIFPISNGIPNMLLNEDEV